ncbi:asparagine synthase [Legionella beliardensis]|uniref:asparagine synthase (glutamine-hydrolyzing) n=1 Tax=Legionella beliardensis TaxID=91822 RepID=A0A378I191_9GAMM|nr:N-acetylglutaminylglutamine amidotransferase [Legionella beliardensis]STX28501.1 asparagine synthase [Legionella beliardensis]
MCGIAGEYHFSDVQVSLPNLKKVISKQYSRGPDDGHIYHQERLAFGHRRLKIFDLSNLAAQPMVDADLGLALVFNGAIYNFLELRRELEAKGYTFKSTSDTEVIIKAYHAWGKQGISRLQGMFAFALWETETGKLILVRDRLGIKPLYYNTNYTSGFKFASTLPALLEFGNIDTTIDKIALHYYLTFHAVPEPFTILAGVRKLQPGTIMTVHANGKVEQERYWQLKIDEEAANHVLTEQDWLETIESALSKATRRQLAADVPIGILLSGGLDSSLLVSMASKEYSQPLHTFSIGFESSLNEQGDEFFYSNLIASHFKTNHQQLFISNKQLAYSLKDCILAMSEPMLSHDNIGFYLLAQEVAKHVKVVLSGQGADEIFAGYHWFHALKDKQAPLPQSAQMIFNLVADRSYQEYQQLVTPSFQTPPQSLLFLEELCLQNGSTYPIDNLLLYESTFALANGPLCRVDNMTMAASLEARVPFLDEAVLELAASLPLRYKLPNEGKYILKKIGQQLLPHQVVNRPKGYFPVPALKHLKGHTLELMQDILSCANIKQRGLFQWDMIQDLFKNSEKNITPLGVSKLWQIGLLEYWLQLNKL